MSVDSNFGDRGDEPASQSVGLPPLSSRRLQTPLLRELLWAPELERYLGVGNLDFSLLDQIEAVKVRVESGLRLLDSRLLATVLAGLRRQMWICAAMGVAGGAALSALFAASRYYPPLCISVALVCAIIAVFAAARWVRLRGDLFVLKQLNGRYKGRVVACAEIKDVLALAREIEAELRGLAGPLEEASAERARDDESPDEG